MPLIGNTTTGQAFLALMIGNAPTHMTAVDGKKQHATTALARAHGHSL
jgi:hypothetical protein